MLTAYSATGRGFLPARSKTGRRLLARMPPSPTCSTSGSPSSPARAGSARRPSPTRSGSPPRPAASGSIVCEIAEQERGSALFGRDPIGFDETELERGPLGDLDRPRRDGPRVPRGPAAGPGDGHAALPQQPLHLPRRRHARAAGGRDDRQGLGAGAGRAPRPGRRPHLRPGDRRRSRDRPRHRLPRVAGDVPPDRAGRPAGPSGGADRGDDHRLTTHRASRSSRPPRRWRSTSRPTLAARARRRPGSPSTRCSPTALYPRALRGRGARRIDALRARAAPAGPSRRRWRRRSPRPSGPQPSGPSSSGCAASSGDAPIHRAAVPVQRRAFGDRRAASGSPRSSDERRRSTTSSPATRSASARARAASARRRPRRRSPSGWRPAACKVAVLTIDPAKRLADSLGLDELGNAPSRVDIDSRRAVDPGGGELWAMMLDAKATFDEVIDTLRAGRGRRGSGSSATGSTSRSPAPWPARRSTWRWRSSTSSTSEGDYDLLILDTPPSRNALDFLDAPQRVTSSSRAGRCGCSSARPASAPGSPDAASAVVSSVLRRITGRRPDRRPLGVLLGHGGAARRLPRPRRAGRGPARRRARRRSWSSPGPPASRSRRRPTCARKLAEGDLPLGGLIVNRVHPLTAGSGDPANPRKASAALAGRAVGDDLAGRADPRGARPLSRILADRDRANIDELAADDRRECR